MSGTPDDVGPVISWTESFLQRLHRKECGTLHTSSSSSRNEQFDLGERLSFVGVKKEAGLLLLSMPAIAP